MTENREQSRSPFSLVTAETIYKRRKLTLVKGGQPSDNEQTPGDFLKQEENFSRTTHSTVDKNNQEVRAEDIAAEVGMQDSVLTNSLKMLAEQSKSREPAT
jgi:hypothetical protein